MITFEVMYLLMSGFSSALLLAMVYIPVRDIANVLLPEAMVRPFIRLLLIGSFVVASVTGRNAMGSVDFFRPYPGEPGNLEDPMNWLLVFGDGLCAAAFTIFFIMLVYSFAALGLVRAQIIAGKTAKIIDEI